MTELKKGPFVSQRRCGGAELRLLAASSLIALLTAELCFRAFEGVPIWQWTDFHRERAAYAGVNAYAHYDANLGWTEKADWKSLGDAPRVSTTRDGIRNSSTGATRPPPIGAILAVGDSFTFGSDVADNETWPAVLERLLEAPVVNAAVEGYGLDQSVLRIEALMASLQPRAVLLGVFEQDILRATYSRFEKPKPYFRVMGEGLERLNYPVPIDALERDDQPWWRLLAGRSYALDRLLTVVDPFDWGGFGYQRTGEDPVSLGCLLLHRLADALRRAGTPLILVMQYAGETIGEKHERPEHVAALIADAQQLGMIVVDEFDDLSSLLREQGPEALGELYFVKSDATFGHRTPEGNERVARFMVSSVQSILASAGPGNEGRASRANQRH
jgi:hypothetical protein